MTSASRVAALCAMLLAISVPIAAAHSAAGHSRFFHSPSGNIQCELDWHLGAGLPNVAYCQTFQPPRSVRLSPNGTLRRCTGSRCLGDGPEGAPALAYGRSDTVGPFHCTSLASGMRCTVASGHGFVLARAGVRRI